MKAILQAAFLVLATCLAGGPLGADYSELSKAEATKLGITGGVVVTRIHEGETLSNQTTMKAGFVITKIGAMPVSSIAGLKYALSRQKSKFIIEGVYPGSKKVYYYSIHDF